jgi:hypothetical protein
MEVMSLKNKHCASQDQFPCGKQIFMGTAPLTAEEQAKFYSGNLKEIRVL